MEQAGGNATGECGSEACEQGQARPERIAPRGVGIAWERVQEQIRQPMPTEMLTQGLTRREDQPCGFNAVPHGLVLQSRPDTVVGFVQPEHAVGDGTQDSHPRGENRRSDLVSIVEATEYEPARGKAGRHPGARPVSAHWCDQTQAGSVRLIAVGQGDDLLGVEGRMLRRRHDRIAHDVVDECGPHAGGIAQIVDLHRGGTTGEDPWAAVLCVALQVDRDVDFQSAGQGADRAVRCPGDVEEVIYRSGQALRHVVGSRRPERKEEHLEFRGIMLFKKFGDQQRGRMRVEVRRKIAQADPLVAGAFGQRQWLGIRDKVRDERRARSSDHIEVIAPDRHDKRRGGRLAPPHGLAQTGLDLVEVAPAQRLGHAKEMVSCCVSRHRIGFQGLFEMKERFFMSASPDECARGQEVVLPASAR